MTALEDARAALDGVVELPNDRPDLHLVIRDNFTSALTPHEVELRAALRALIAEHGAALRQIDGLADELRAEMARPPEWEYGVEYEVSNTESVFTAAHSEDQARKWVEESPTDTGFRRRRPAGPWEETR